MPARTFSLVFQKGRLDLFYRLVVLILKGVRVGAGVTHTSKVRGGDLVFSFGVGFHHLDVGTEEPLYPSFLF